MRTELPGQGIRQSRMSRGRLVPMPLIALTDQNILCIISLVQILYALCIAQTSHIELRRIEVPAQLLHRPHELLILRTQCLRYIHLFSPIFRRLAEDARLNFALRTRLGKHAMPEVVPHRLGRA
jgi:hypothetical protein